MRGLFIATLACICIAAPVASRAADTCSTDRAQIIALIDRYQAAFRAKDLDRIMSFYAPGKSLVAFDVEPPRQYVGWQAYKKDWQGFFAALKGPVTDTITDLSIDCDGTLGFSHNIERITGMLTNGKKFDVTVRATDVYRKINGKWYAIHEHVSVPVNLDTGQADLQSKP